MSASARILAQKKEYDAVEGLEHNAHALRETFLAFAKQLKSAQDGAQSIGNVLANWPHMFSVISSFAQVHEATATALAFKDANEPTLEDQPPTRLVRVMIEGANEEPRPSSSK
ncbi:uncharacterized protein EI90DRAFT_3153999 [Cantharellus anzutake]|uniref:uncharacterized protein n=1 Tax=Cantharellus anzutake TaxID=1750568 RepID=UPI001902CBCE|nr:uncharacterized protein EI90DRAFT_3153999 [Cantharellus anzutake]KAF8332637.1 hypothetical protein EI90DRAFT_3153999 [Cantharellus anzutake]